MKKRVKRISHVSRIKKIERFIEKQMEKYLRIHKEHEKDLSYIG